MHLLFDFGGVIVDLQRETCLKAFDTLGFDLRPFLGTYQQAGVFSLLENGDLCIEDFCQEIRNMASAPTLSNTTIIEAWQSYLVGIPQNRLALLRRIKQNYPCHLLSNTNPIHWQQSVKQWFETEGYGMSDYFDQLFLSYELHLQKPNPSIFHHVIEKLGVPAQDILFLDDSIDNCESARRCGLQAVLAPAHGAWHSLFDDYGTLRNPSF